MPAKKHFFTREKKTLKQPLKHIGNKSGKIREKEAIEAEPLGQKNSSVKVSEAKKIELPNNPQKITEKTIPHVRFAFSWQTSMIIAFFVTVAIFTSWQGYTAVQKGIQMKQVLSQRKNLIAQLTLWENIAQKYPGYRDADFQVAVLSYQLGDRVTEKTYLDKVLLLDPNYEPAKKLAAK